MLWFFFVSLTMEKVIIMETMISDCMNFDDAQMDVRMNGKWMSKDATAYLAYDIAD